MPPMNPSGDADALVREHVAAESSLEDFGSRVVDMIGLLLADAKVRTHSIVHRVKKAESLRHKIEVSPDKYRQLSDITDTLGIRVITYFPDDVDAAARVIEANFEIDSINSVDRRAKLEPDRFGYLSLHYIAQLSGQRRDLPEYRAHRVTKFEVQVRSILQHTWAEIEHDLGYKAPSAVPAHVRRRFSRLAGLLEFADDEFASIRDALTDYAATVEHALEEDPSEVGIDRDSLFAYMANSGLLAIVDDEVRIALGAASLSTPHRAYASSRAEELSRVGYASLAEVDEALHERAGEVARFARAWNGGNNRAPSPARGVALFYLFLLNLAGLAREGGLRESHIKGGFQTQRWGELLELEPLRAALVASLAEAAEIAGVVDAEASRPNGSSG